MWYTPYIWKRCDKERTIEGEQQVHRVRKDGLEPLKARLRLLGMKETRCSGNGMDWWLPGTTPGEYYINLVLWEDGQSQFYLDTITLDTLK